MDFAEIGILRLGIIAPRVGFAAQKILAAGGRNESAEGDIRSRLDDCAFAAVTAVTVYMVLRSTKHSAAVLANVPIAVGADVVTDAHSTPKPLGLAGAFLFAVAMTEGKTRLISAPIAAFCVALMSIGMLDYYVGVFWPDPVLQQWIAVRL